MTEKIQKRVLVTGACRSGTTTMSRYLRDAGLDAPHEKMGEDGTVSCMFFMDAPYYPKSAGRLTHDGDHKFSDYEFGTIIHLVRHPLRAIPSQAAVYSRDHIRWLHEQGLVDEATRPRTYHAAKLWLKVNRHVERMTRFRVRIEDLSDSGTWERLRKRLRLSGEQPHARHMNKSSGFRRRDPLTWRELYEMDKGLAEQIRKTANRYGYQ